MADAPQSGNAMTHSTELTNKLDQLRSGELEARDALIEYTVERLRKLARKMLRGFPAVRRWSETDDVLQNAMIRLHRSLAAVAPSSSAEFFGLAATQIRRELLDLAKHFHGPEGIGANHHTDTGSVVSGKQDQQIEPANLESWSRFHNAVESLPDDERQVVNLLWYEALSQPEAAEAIGVSLATIKRRWASARLKLCDGLEEWQVD